MFRGSIFNIYKKLSLKLKMTKLFFKKSFIFIMIIFLNYLNFKLKNQTF